MNDLSPRINLLRLRIQMVDQVYRSNETHDLLQECLKSIWDDAIDLHGGDKTKAAKFLLQPFGYFDGKTAFDTIIEGDEGVNRYNQFLNTLHLSFQ